jgi:hypothetical protein
VIQDREQKRAALKYAVAKRWFPQLELNVATFITLSRSPTNITDVDVFAAVPDDLVGFRNVVIDCKTRKGESPISRAMWQRGLMARLNADHGICVLRVPRIVADHRYTAAQFGVALVAEREFDSFASATAPGYRLPLGAIADLDTWEKYFAVGTQFPNLAKAVEFSRSGFWMSDSAAEACIRAVFLMTSLRPELDPEKREHLTLVADITSLFLHALARIVVQIFAGYLQPGAKNELSTALLLFLYGGRSSYDHLNRIRRMVAQITGSAPVTVSRGSPDQTESGSLGERAANKSPSHAPDQSQVRDLALPEWDRFVELVRQMLDAPLEVSRAPLFLREVGWTILAGNAKSQTGTSSFAQELAASSPQGARFALLGLAYLCRAAVLPKEFKEELGSRVIAAQTRSASVTRVGL